MSGSLIYTSTEDINRIHGVLKASFRNAVTRPIQYRRNQLLQLARMVQENEELLVTALHKDSAKQRLEAVSFELAPVVSGAVRAAENVEEWSKPIVPEVEQWKASFGAKVLKVPKGVALIIAPWNYPLILCLQPLIGAIAAGCPAVVKPSEVSPHVAQALADLFPKYLDASCYALVNGAVKETTALLALPWDHIFYTGNGHVGRIVATAAAKHLTPCTLELGGQSPVVIDQTADLKIAAKRVLWGKAQNSGQLCVSPNHVFILRSMQEAFVQALKEAYQSFWPQGPLADGSSFGRIISPHHFDRVNGYLSRTKGTVVVGGDTEGKRGMGTAIVSDVKFDDSMLQEELFGPLLALVPVDSIDEAINWINDHDNPLAMYIFTEDEGALILDAVAARTNSGSLVFNDTVYQLAFHEIPFGGHGGSGYGYQHGPYTFNTFTHLRSSIDVPKSVEPHLAIRYPPYTEEALNALGAGLHTPIPKSAVTNGKV